ncbi:MAG: HAD-IC family P-type ATPase, partial [Proteobacteria bacterium]|nr:HAD-IC family P-type ATPase [Pseudomonadota bacterium]
MKYNFKGLNSQSVQKSREQNGTNEIAPPKMEGFWEKLIGNFKDPIIFILVVALAITVVLAIFGFAKWYEGVGIAIAVIIATLVATLSEYKNETSFQKLQEEASRIEINVFRDGHISKININDIVVGDYALLQPGDKIPADGKIVDGELEVDQAVLTGESEPVEKKAAPSEYSLKQKNDLSDPHRVFRASVVNDGEAVMEVDIVGDRTIQGQTVRELEHEERKTPLQVKLSALGDGISKFGYIGGTFIALAFLFKKVFMDHHFVATEIVQYLSQWQVFLHDVVTAVILAVIIIVVAVPEGLPMMIAIVLSLNMRKLLRAKVLVRKLLGIESSGSLNILFSDKTGTITRGQLQVVEFVPGGSRAYREFMSIPDKLRDLLAFSLKHNTTSVIDLSDNNRPKVVGGNRTEQALLEFIEPVLSEKSDIKVAHTIAFNSARKFSAMQITGERNLTLVKGAPEIIIKSCKDYYDENENKTKLKNVSALTNEINRLSNRAMRVIAMATSEEAIADDKRLPSSLTLVGIIGIRDELRNESAQAIQEAQRAGIQVVMITGDRKETAVAIAKDAGLLKDPNDIVLTSSEISRLSDNKLKKLMPNLKVVARALPTDKSRLVKVAQDIGLVVGMTGDGVNDAPALKKADVGFAMGSGSEVAKEAGDIVILDDNFSSITKAVLYGRTI